MTDYDAFLNNGRLSVQQALTYGIRAVDPTLQAPSPSGLSIWANRWPFSRFTSFLSFFSWSLVSACERKTCYRFGQGLSEWHTSVYRATTQQHPYHCRYSSESSALIKFGPARFRSCKQQDMTTLISGRGGRRRMSAVSARNIAESCGG